jgi:CubicO group peptidase (beta-lactamase class C family)
VSSAYQARDGIAVHGVVEDGYGPVMDEFVRNFRDRQDLGAGCTAYVGGRAVVDLWAGIADRASGRPFEHDNATVIFSCTKGVMAVCAYLLVQQGRLDLDLPIAHYWPEFAQAGKERITVRHAMAHRAGLAYLDTDLTLDDVVAWDPVIHAIEGQAPHHAPEDGHAYHAATIGWLLGEVIRRITGMSPGTYFRTALGEPLGLHTWIGLPAGERIRVAWMEPPLPDDDSEFAKGFARLANEPHLVRAMSLGKAFAFPSDNGQVTFNNPVIQAAEIPGAGGISSAAALARLYAACVTGVDGGAALLTPVSIADGLRVQSAGPQLTGQPDDGARWGTGFQISSPPTQPLLGPTSFGHTGAGGQLAFADAEHGASFAYLTNQMGGYGDQRAPSLVSALRRVLGG